MKPGQRRGSRRETPPLPKEALPDLNDAAGMDGTQLVNRWVERLAKGRYDMDAPVEDSPLADEAGTAPEELEPAAFEVSVADPPEAEPVIPDEPPVAQPLEPTDEEPREPDWTSELMRDLRSRREANDPVVPPEAQSLSIEPETEDEYGSFESEEPGGTDEMFEIEIGEPPAAPLAEPVFEEVSTLETVAEEETYKAIVLEEDVPVDGLAESAALQEPDSLEVSLEPVEEEPVGMPEMAPETGAIADGAADLSLPDWHADDEPSPQEESVESQSARAELDLPMQEPDDGTAQEEDDKPPEAEDRSEGGQDQETGAEEEPMETASLLEPVEEAAGEDSEPGTTDDAPRQSLELPLGFTAAAERGISLEGQEEPAAFDDENPDEPETEAQAEFEPEPMPEPEPEEEFAAIDKTDEPAPLPDTEPEQRPDSSTEEDGSQPAATGEEDESSIAYVEQIVRKSSLLARGIAAVIDLAIVLTVLAICLGVGALVMGVVPSSGLTDLARLRPLIEVLALPSYLLLLILTAGYFVLFHGSVGQTIGKMMVGARVVDTEGNPLGYARAFLRYVGWLFSASFFLLGFVWAVFDFNKQGWHDKLAHSCVVRSRDLSS